MIRNVDFDTISDGKRYMSGDLVRADCLGCRGCSACCRGMGGSVVLDPLDCFKLEEGLSLSFDGLARDKLELRVVDGHILPNLCMDGEGDACVFLGKDGRCTVYSFRPGNCRLFPLGRIYEDRFFSYFLQTGECKMERRAKIKVKKWLDLPDLEQYERFAADWHCFLKDLRRAAAEAEDEQRRNIELYVLQVFYREPFETGDFYPQFYRRLEAAKALFGL